MTTTFTIRPEADMFVLLMHVLCYIISCMFVFAGAVRLFRKALLNIKTQI